MKCLVLRATLINDYERRRAGDDDCIREQCALGWDKDTNQCVFLAFERIAKALEKLANRINVQIAR